MDVSDIRPVPDAQEIFVDRNGLTNIVFDLAERVDEFTDENAVNFHLDDIVDPSDTMRKWSLTPTNMSHFPPNVPAYKAIAVIHKPSQLTQVNGSTNHHSGEHFVALLVLVIRMQEQSTDLVVTVNVPHLPGTHDFTEADLAGGRLSPLIETGLEYLERVTTSLEIKDLSILGL